jgi:hypothetical protein
LPSNATLLTAGIWFIGLYFSGQILHALWLLFAYRRIRSLPLATWESRRHPLHLIFVGIGTLSLGLAWLGVAQDQPLENIWAQMATAGYFLIATPLLERARLGFYEGGIWSGRGHLAWDRIGRLAFREVEGVELVLVPRGRGLPLRLEIPPDEYGAVRRILRERIRRDELHMEPGLLGVGDPPDA